MLLWRDHDTSHGQQYYHCGMPIYGCGYYYHLLTASPLTEWICGQFNCALSDVNINLQIQRAHLQPSYHTRHRDSYRRQDKIIYILEEGGSSVWTNWYESMDSVEPIYSQQLHRGHWYSIRVDQPHDVGRIETARTAISLGFK
jgi:hypothetical protein